MHNGIIPDNYSLFLKDLGAWLLPTFFAYNHNHSPGVIR